MSSTYRNIPDSGSPSWKTPVSTFSQLPSTGNSDGDARVTIDTETIYIWGAGSWHSSGGGGSGVTAVMGTSPIASSGGTTPTISIQTASSSQSGALSATDWNTFNNKQSTLTPGTISSSTTGVTVGNGTASTVGPAVTINIQTASNSQQGLLSATDHTYYDANRTTFVFNPGAATVSQNVYTTWTSLAADLSKSQGLRYVLFDPSGGGSNTLPVGVNSVDGVMFITGHLPVSLNFPNTVALSPGFLGFDGQFTITSNSGSPVITYPSGTADISLSGLSTLANSGGSQFFSLLTGATVNMTLNRGFSIENPGNRREIGMNSGTLLNLVINDNSALFGDTINSAAVSSDVEVTLSADGILDQNQPNFNGTLSTIVTGAAAQVNFLGSSNIDDTDVNTAITNAYTGQGIYQDVIPTSSSTVSIGDGVKWFNMNPTGAITSLTINMPVNPLPGQEIVISTSINAITSCTLASGITFYTGAAVTTIAANSAVRYVYDDSKARWRKV